MKNTLKRLDARCIGELLPHNIRMQLGEILVMDCVTSTNEVAREAIAHAIDSADLHGRIYFAEAQSQGRGRNGHAWVSPYGCNLYASLIWRFEQGITHISGLSLALGLAVLTALEALGVSGLQLKWPNDVLINKKKVAGILVETSGDLLGPCCAVIGIGINAGMTPEQGADIEQSWIALRELLDESLIDRNQIAAMLLAEVVNHLTVLSQKGFRALQVQWNAHDAFAEQPIAMTWSKQRVEGIGKGVREDGALCVQVNNELHYFLSGEISMRMNHSR